MLRRRKQDCTRCIPIWKRGRPALRSLEGAACLWQRPCGCTCALLVLAPLRDAGPLPRSLRCLSIQPSRRVSANADGSGTRLRVETIIERMGSSISTARCIVSSPHHASPSPRDADTRSRTPRLAAASPEGCTPACVRPRRRTSATSSSSRPAGRRSTRTARCGPGRSSRCTVGYRYRS